MKKHNKLKLTNNEDRGFTRGDWAGMIIMSIICILAGAGVLAFFIAIVRWVAGSI